MEGERRQHKNNLQKKGVWTKVKDDKVKEFVVWSGGGEKV